MCLLIAAGRRASAAEAGQPPGVVIDHSPAASGIYIGSPSLAVLGNGDYLASHDQFGPKSTENTSGVTVIFRSGDKGRTWEHLTDIHGAYWSTLFEHKASVYLIGLEKQHGNAVIRRSSDGGRTWTTPRVKGSGVLPEGQYHCAPVPVCVHGGRIWRAIEEAGGGKKWGERYRAMMMSAPVDADLLDAGSWTFSNYLARDPQWLDGKFNAWLEGNALATPDGHVVDVLRVDAKESTERAAIVHISDDGKTASFDPAAGFVEFPGGAKKFTIRADPRGGIYWSLSSAIPVPVPGKSPASVRNTLVLISSPDLVHWTTRCILLHHPEVVKHGFQYVDWQFDGEDLIAACRTAYDDGAGGANSAHNANFLTFHRFAKFRELTLKDSVPVEGFSP